MYQLVRKVKGISVEVSKVVHVSLSTVEEELKTKPANENWVIYDRETNKIVEPRNV